MIRIEKLSEDNFHHYEFLTTLDKEKPCYCSWWHINPESMENYDQEKRDNPEKFRNCIYSKVQSGFHVGVIAFEDETPMAWISIGPVNQFFWAWKRTLDLQEKAEKTAAIMCFNTAPIFRGKNKFIPIMEALMEYGRKQNWLAIEGYPFDDSALKKHGDAVLWPGLTSEFLECGFNRIAPHWLSNDNAERSIYSKNLQIHA